MSLSTTELNRAKCKRWYRRKRGENIPYEICGPKKGYKQSVIHIQRKKHKGAMQAGKYVHRILNVNSELRTGTCSICGNVKLHQRRPGKWRCGTAVKIYSQLKRAIPRSLKPSNCEICGKESEDLCFDHCHLSNIHRGWLCALCNGMLGMAKDDVVILQKGIDYLNKVRTV